MVQEISDIFGDFMVMNHPEVVKIRERERKYALIKLNPRRSVYEKEYYNKNKEKIKEQVKAWIKKHPEKQKEYSKRGQVVYSEQRKNYARMKYYNRNIEKEEMENTAIKLECFKIYSENKIFCACCGETNYSFLTLDHTNNDGYLEKRVGTKKRLGGIQLYKCLKRRGFPNKEKFQVLCWNCNCGKDMNGGICPHKEIGDRT